MGYFGNRISPGQPGAIYPVELKVAHSRTPLKLVGPGDVVVSAAGLSYGNGSTPMTAYNPRSGPKLVAAKLSVMSTAGEGSRPSLSGALPNDAGASAALCGRSTGFGYSRAVGSRRTGSGRCIRTDFSEFFRIETVDANGVVRWLTQTGSSVSVAKR